MSLTTIIFLSGTVAMFASFVGVLGGVTLWLAISDRRDRAAQRAYVASFDERPKFREAA